MLTPALRPYRDNHLQAVGLSDHWLADEPAGPLIYDRAGANTGNANSGVSRIATPFGYGLDLDGASGIITTTTQYTNPTVFTLSLWFRTATASGKKLIGFEDKQTGTGTASFDRHLYIGTDGLLRYGVYNGGGRIIATSGSVADGDWHHCVAVQSSAQASLYLDGKWVGTIAYATSAAYAGWWRIGGYMMNGAWSNGAAGYFTGQLADIRVYSRALSDAEALALYAHRAALREPPARLTRFGATLVTYLLRQGTSHGFSSGAAPRTALASASGQSGTVNPAAAPRRALASAAGHSWSFDLTTAPRQARQVCSGHSHDAPPAPAGRRGLHVRPGFSHDPTPPVCANRRGFYTGSGLGHSLGVAWAARRALAIRSGWASGMAPAWSGRLAVSSAQGVGASHDLPPGWAGRVALTRGAGVSYPANLALGVRRAVWTAAGLGIPIAAAFGGTVGFRIALLNGVSVERIDALNGIGFDQILTINGVAL